MSYYDKEGFYLHLTNENYVLQRNKYILEFDFEISPPIEINQSWKVALKSMNHNYMSSDFRSDALNMFIELDLIRSSRLNKSIRPILATVPVADLNSYKIKIATRDKDEEWLTIIYPFSFWSPLNPIYMPIKNYNTYSVIKIKFTDTSGDLLALSTSKIDRKFSFTLHFKKNNI